MNLPVQPGSCSGESLQAGEALFGSAPFATTWLLLEYDKPWGAKAWAESDIPPAVKAHLDAALSGLPDSRLQLVRQRPRLAGGGLNFFIARLNGAGPQLYHLVLDAYQDLLHLDLGSFFHNRAALSSYRIDGPLFMVCTNGSRDPCCALFGTRTYSALSAEYGPAVWQTTHVGGHRFAANLICLPEGVCYGRVRPETAVELAHAQSQGRIELEHYRGCSLYPQAVQAAEALLRSNLGLDGLRDLAFESVETISDQSWRVVFQDRAGVRHLLQIELLPGLYRTRLSCRDVEPGSTDGYRLVKYTKQTKPS